MLLVIHVLYVSETFTEPGPPRLAVLVTMGFWLTLWLWIRTRWWRAARKPWAVSRIDTTGSDCTCVELTPTGNGRFAYTPGQFTFVSFRCASVTREPHAFSLSSTPSRPGRLQFTIRACGDWTRDAARLAVGDRALIQGPFGRFGHLFIAPHRDLILIAGGIGITSMLSMLRYMAGGKDTRPITLIWSNRPPQAVVFADEIDALATGLTGLRRIPIFTRNAEKGKRSGRLNRRSLATMLESCSRSSAVFVCVPPRMMNRITKDLKAIGFPARSIFCERFGF